MEVIGQKACQPIGDCGTGTWGKIEATASTVFVDKSYAGGASDGSAGKPYVTIGAAVASAKSGAQIAIAAGTYSEDLLVDKTLVIEGRCAAMVKLQGQGATALKVLGAGVEVRGVSITGSHQGLLVEGGVATVERVQVSDCPEGGVAATNGAKLTLRQSVVADNGLRGIWVAGAKATLQGLVVRGTSGAISGTSLVGGIIGEIDAKLEPAEVVVQDSLIVGNQWAGVHLRSSSGTIDRSSIAGNLVDATGGGGWEAGGWGVSNHLGGAVTIRDSLIANNQATGVHSMSATATVERCVIRGSLRGGMTVETCTPHYGCVGPNDNRPGELTVRDSLVVGNHADGAVIVADSKATLEGTIVRDTLPLADQTRGMGVAAFWEEFNQGHLVMRDCLVVGNHLQGVGVFGATAHLERVVVRDTQAQHSDQAAGYGITTAVGSSPSYEGASLTVLDSLVAGNLDTGVNVYGGSIATLERTIVQDSRWAVVCGGSPPDLHRSSSLAARDCLVANNRVGIANISSTVVLQRSVIRDTQMSLGEELPSGVGIAAWDDPPIALPPVLEAHDCLVARNSGMGVLLQNSETSLERTVVRDTQPFADNSLGLGLYVVHISGGAAPSLTARDCSIANNRTGGAALFGTRATLDRVVVRDTQPELVNEQGNAAIVVGYNDGQPSLVEASDSLLQQSTGTGLLIASATASLVRCVVRDTTATPSGSWGDGIMAMPDPSESAPSTLSLADSLVENSTRAGLIFYGGGGSVLRSVFRKGVFAIDLEDAAAPDVGNDNVYEGNMENRVTWGNKLAPSPMPKIPGL
jgi:hypothetical protein